MTETIVQLLNDKKFSQQVVTEQLDDLQKVTWDSAAQKVLKIYRNVFTGKR